MQNFKLITQFSKWSAITRPYYESMAQNYHSKFEKGLKMKYWLKQVPLTNKGHEPQYLCKAPGSSLKGTDKSAKKVQYTEVALACLEALRWYRCIEDR